MTRYKISWTDAVGYYTYIEADSKEEAIRKFNVDGPDSIEPDGCVEQQDDLDVEEM